MQSDSSLWTSSGNFLCYAYAMVLVLEAYLRNHEGAKFTYQLKSILADLLRAIFCDFLQIRWTIAGRQMAVVLFCT